MLWMKSWLETRWRFSLMMGFALLTILMGEEGGGLHSAENARNLILVQSTISILAAINLAGAGIRTQSPFRRKAGLHGSTHYTLSLPVSRARLLGVRALVGLIETAGVVTFMSVSAWLLFPLVRGTSTANDLLKHLLAIIACVLCVYCVSVVIATVLDEMWQVYGSLCLVGLGWWTSAHLALPSSANVFGFATGASPLVTHSLPWVAMFASVAVSAALFLIALKIVSTHEY
jgi:hypothetical protein